jgi:tRNA threonylcarbamoyladenosine dehydratase
MSFDFLSRTSLLIGEKSLDFLKNSRIIVFGLGGVGAIAAEMLIRSGIGHLTIVDGDKIVLSNLNRQIQTLRNNLGLYKTEIIKERLLSINPESEIIIISEFIDRKHKFETILTSDYDLCIDAIDTLTNKVHLIVTALNMKIPVISSLGAGGKLDPTQVTITDISETYNCRLAYYVRKKLKKYGIHEGVRVVFSSEPPKKESITLEEKVFGKKSTIGTISYLPNIFGCFAASESIRLLLSQKGDSQNG